MSIKAKHGSALSLRYYRRQAGFTQQELADASGVSVGAVRALECNDREHPRIDTLRKLAVALRVKPADLLDGPPGAPEFSFMRRVRFVRSSLLSDELPTAEFGLHGSDAAPASPGAGQEPCI